MAKIKKRMSKKELQAPDQVEVVLNETWDNLVAYRKWIIGAVALFVVGGVSWAIIHSLRDSAKAEAALALRDAMGPLTAFVDAPADGADAPKAKPIRGVKIFPSEAAATTEAAKRLDAFLAAHPDMDAAQVVSLTRAEVWLRQGDAARAAKDLQSWLGQHAESPLAPAALQALAQAQLATGKRDEARKTLTDLAAKSTGPAKALALTSLGDLDNPLITKGGDAAKARTHYEGAEKALGPKPQGDNPFVAMSAPYLFRELTNKLALLP